MLMIMANHAIGSSLPYNYNNQDTVTWEVLSMLEYFEAPHKEYGTVYLPKFDKKVKKLHQKTVYIKGYLVPVDRQTWALSRTTYANCFFCGKAGPETVLGLTFKKDPGRLKMDTYVILKGRFVVNGEDVDDWMYQMVDVEIFPVKR